jgi:hypothetical protein
MQISHEEYIEAVNLCKDYLAQQLKFNELQFKYSKTLEIHSVRDKWMKMTAPFKIRVLNQKRKGIIFKIGDILNVTRVAKIIWLQNGGDIEREVKEIDLSRNSVYRCQITLYYNLTPNGKERFVRIYFNEDGVMDTFREEFTILKQPVSLS